MYWVFNQNLKGYGSSNRYEVGQALVDKIKNGMELSEAIETLLSIPNGTIKSSKGMSGIITNGIIDRSDSYVDAAIFSFAPFVSDLRLWKNSIDTR
jgi:non-canonical (house-cleaning) NTP pyrophosphatase